MQHMAARISFDLRSKYLRSLLKQEVQYFEEQSVEALPAKLSQYFSEIGEGTGEKMGQVFYTSAIAISGTSIGLYYGPILALCCMAFYPIIGVIIMIWVKMMKNTMKNRMMQTEKLGSHTEEMLGAVKVVQSFAQESVSIGSYDKLVDETK